MKASRKSSKLHLTVKEFQNLCKCWTKQQKKTVNLANEIVEYYDSNNRLINKMCVLETYIYEDMSLYLDQITEIFVALR